MDEPFAGVDIKTERLLIACLKELVSQGKTVVVVHHDLQTVRAYFDHVVMINQTLVAAGATETCFTAENIQRTFQFREEGEVSNGE